MWSTLLLISTAQAIDVSFSCLPNEGAIVGLPPLEVSCTLDAPDGEWGETVWLFGDGAIASGDVASHTYQTPGQYSISVSLDDYVEYDSGIPFTSSPGLRKDALVTVCGKPSPRFSYIDKGGRVYQMVNITDVSTPRCIDHVRWEVFQGQQLDREPIVRLDGWEPRFELPRDGIYTIRLTTSGLGGSTIAQLVMEARYGLTEEIGDHYAVSCATGSAPWASLPLLLVVGLLRRRSPQQPEAARSPGPEPG